MRACTRALRDFAGVFVSRFRSFCFGLAESAILQVHAGVFCAKSLIPHRHSKTCCPLEVPVAKVVRPRFEAAQAMCKGTTLSGRALVAGGVDKHLQDASEISLMRESFKGPRRDCAFAAGSSFQGKLAGQVRCDRSLALVLAPTRSYATASAPPRDWTLGAEPRS